MQESLGRKLRLMRAERGLSLREAARRAGVVKETISDIERGHTHPYDVTLAKLARAYDVPLEELLEESVPLAEAPRETGPSLLERALDAARQDEEKIARAIRRGAASEGVSPITSVSAFEEDNFRAELRARGFPDEHFEDFIWPLVSMAVKADRLEEELTRLREERERESAQHQ